MPHAAAPIMAAIFLAAPAVGQLSAARAQSATERQAQCELSAIRDTRSVAAIQTIRSACNWLALNGGSLLNESLKPYYVCLVQNLSGAQSDAAVGPIVNACRASHMR
jgi:curli biogenesis system outer membrane secretion channel CsgG